MRPIYKPKMPMKNNIVPPRSHIEIIILAKPGWVILPVNDSKR